MISSFLLLPSHNYMQVTYVFLMRLCNFEYINRSSSLFSTKSKNLFASTNGISVKHQF